MRTFLFTLTALVLIASGILAFKKPDVVPETGGEPNNQTYGLTGTSWVWQQTQFADGTIMVPNKAHAFVVTFTTDGAVSGTTDCNDWGSTYTTAGETIRLASIVSTLKFCEYSEESPYFSQIGGADTFSFDAKGNLIMVIEIDDVGTAATMTYAPSRSRQDI